MSTQPFDIGLVRDRIRQGVSEKELRQVQGSADYAAVTALRDFPAPCCYVLLAREVPLETKTGVSIPGQQSRLAQMVEVNFAVVTVCRNYREQRGAQVIDELRLLLGKVRQPLLAREMPLETKTGASIPGQQARLAQLVEVNFAVVTVCRNYREQRGAQVIDELRLLLGKVRQPLLGWTPPIPGGRACQLIEGNLEDYDAATALWVDVWKTQAVLQPEIPR